MADWRQIQARIRKAKLSADPAPALMRIYDRTRDGMAAFELAHVHETAGRMEEAVGWYSKAWQRFRRADWKQKAADAVERLGGELPQEIPQEAAQGIAAGEAADTMPVETGPMNAGGETAVAESEPRAEFGMESTPPVSEAGSGEGESQPAAAGGAGDEARKKRSRRGRRGGRRHRAKRERQARAQGQTQPQPATAAAEPETAEEKPAPPPREKRGRPERAPRRAEPEPATEPGAPRVGSEFAAQVRTVDPGLASRLAKLEAKLRRMLASPAYPMSDVDQAPAGPGVFVLSDSDHVSYYYVEACRTLRIAIGNIARARGGEHSLKKGLAEHLGISESQVVKYVKEHCVVRWLQLDEDSSLLAHFAIAVLGPVLNE